MKLTKILNCLIKVIASNSGKTQITTEEKVKYPPINNFRKNIPQKFKIYIICYI